MPFPWSRWVSAFVEASPHEVRWIHLESYNVKGYNPRKIGKKKARKIEEKLYADERWVEVPFAESDDEFQDMRAFATTKEAGRGSRDLLMALGRDKPFRGFREALERHPEALANWEQSRRIEAERRLWAFCKAMEFEQDHPELIRVAALLEAEGADEDDLDED